MIKTFYSTAVPNFGDLLNEHIVAHLTKQKIIKAGKYSADLLAIGSVLQCMTYRKPYKYPYYLLMRTIISKPLHVWGSGFISENSRTDLFRRNMVFHAVRGKISLARLKKCGFDTTDTQLGDPGLLCSELIEKQPKKFKFGIIPHFFDRDNHHFLELKELPDSIYIDVTGDPITTLKQIAQCETIISSAMHGLIAADALGIPNLWVTASDKVEGNGYKFNDYYSAFEMPETPSVFDLETNSKQEISKEFIIKRYLIKPAKVLEIQNRLKNCFPLKELTHRKT